MGASAGEIKNTLQAAFRDRIANFYRALHITPPYHSVEKAVLALRDALAPMALSDLNALTTDDASVDVLFTQIVRDSGLAKKHRGIIKGLLRNGSAQLPAECRALADVYRN